MHTHEKKEHPRSEEGTKCLNGYKNRRLQTAQNVKLKKKRKEPSNDSLSDLLSKLQPVAHVPLTLQLSHHVPRL